MSDIDLAVRGCKKLESLLEKLGATGRGLHEKVSSVESRLPEAVTKKLRFIATVRNKIVHEAEYEKIDDRARFVEACKTCERELRKLGGGGAGRNLWRGVAALIALLAIAAAVIYWRRPR